LTRSAASWNREADCAARSEEAMDASGQVENELLRPEDVSIRRKNI
jgi:hypothetical protein